MPFTLTVEVTDQYYVKWIEDVDLSISDGVSNYNGVATSGIFTREITYNSVGDYTITIEATDAKTLTKQITVSAAEMKVIYYNSVFFT